MFLKYTVLFAEDFLGQYENLAISTERLNIKTEFCCNNAMSIEIAVMEKKPSIVVFSSRDYSFEEISALINKFSG